MLTTKSLARTAAATAGLALVVAGAAAPAGAAEDAGADRGQDRAAAQSESRRAAAAEKRSSVAKGRSADAPHGKAYGPSAAQRSSTQGSSARADARGSSDARTQTSNQGLGDERGDGHTPVTVCHATGNGEFVAVTFDENAFDKHVENHMKHMAGHQDYVVEEGTGCEEVATTATGTTATDTTATGLLTATGTDTVTDEEATAPDAQVLGVEAFAARTGAGVEAPAVLGAEAVAAGSAGVPVTGPLAGILPQTGAAPMALAATAGLGLLGAGATMLRRRRAV